MARIIKRVLLALLVTTAFSCQRFEASTPAQCEAALKNTVSVRLGAAPSAPPVDGQKQGFLDQIKRKAKKGASGVAFSAFKLSKRYADLLRTCESEWSVHVTQCLSAGKSMADFTECKNWPWDKAPSKSAE